MAGHSKWKQIQRQKGVADAKRGQIFTKLTREIMVAARQGGGDPNMNPRLRIIINKAREQNMPMDNIERAIKRAVGAGDGAASLEEGVYEAYGPGGVAIMVYVVTDNRNRAVSELRNVFDRNNGKMAQAGSVAWLFQQRGVIAVEELDREQAEELALMAIDLGAEDFDIDGSLLEVRCSPERFEALRRALEEKGMKIASAELAMTPSSTVPLDEKTAEQALKLLDRLEELDDVQRVYSNADFPQVALERYSAAA